MSSRGAILARFRRMAVFSLLVALSVPAPAEGQVLKKLQKTVTDAAEDEAMNQADRMVRSAIQCAFDDPICIEEAEASGEEFVLVDDSGEVITDDDGTPVQDPGAAAAIVAESAPKPGEGAWANFDFVPGDRVLLYDDYLEDNVGDFPMRFDLIQGSYEIIEWQGERYARAISSGLVALPLPETLPEQFTIEFSVNLPHGNAFARLTTGRAYYGRSRTYKGTAVSIEHTRGGVRDVGGGGPQSLGSYDAAIVRDEVAPVKVMADGDHMKVYVGENRVANIPNAIFPRTDTLFLAVGSATADKPVLIGPIRVAGGGRDLYGRLEREGRVATQGIYFDVNSARIRPESTATLEEIGEMLVDHPELRLSIEGHTDSDGDDAYNQSLSDERAAAVRAYLIESYGVDASRLESTGMGETAPAATNDTPEGKQQNRRVELVKLN